MDIRVGGSSPVGPTDSGSPGRSNTVEARVLSVRSPRRRRRDSGRQGSERRRSGQGPDPASGRVLVLLVPEGGQLPAKLEQGGYRVFLRFVRR